jgi:hypothetical protein
VSSSLTLYFRAVVLTLAVLAVALGLLAGQNAAQLIESRAADFSQVLLGEGR